LTLLINLAVLAVAIVFHRRVDGEVFAGAARAVFTRTLALAYLAGVALFWAATALSAALLLATGRTSAETTNPAVVIPGFLLVLGYVVVVWIVQVRAEHASTRAGGPLAALGRFIRLGYGTGAAAATRHLGATD